MKSGGFVYIRIQMKIYSFKNCPLKIHPHVQGATLTKIHNFKQYPMNKNKNVQIIFANINKLHTF